MNHDHLEQTCKANHHETESSAVFIHRTVLLGVKQAVCADKDRDDTESDHRQIVALEFHDVFTAVPIEIILLEVLLLVGDPLVDIVAVSIPPDQVVLHEAYTIQSIEEAVDVGYC